MMSEKELQGNSWKLGGVKIYSTSLFGWWFGTVFTFPYIGNNNPN
jgi:hypothetical protein